MKLSILIATLGRRKKLLKRLLDCLMPQVEQYPGEVEVIAFWNNGKCKIGDIRQELLNEAKGDYICFVDDDDMVPEYYVKEIMDNLGKDYIGFRVELYSDGQLKPPVTHSLQYPNWSESYDGYFRDVTHLNPIKREIALQGNFDSKEIGEDAKWAESIKHLVKTENFIDRVMYFYYHNSYETAFKSTKANPPAKPLSRLNVKSKQFKYHPGSEK